MKREYMNPTMLMIDVSADVDTVSVSGTGDGIIVDLGKLLDLE